MDRPAPATDGLCPSVVAPAGRSRLFRKYAALLVAVVSADWFVFVELPTHEAFGSIYNSIFGPVILLVAALAVALLAGLALARRMVVPIRALRDGAARVGGGDLAHRISIKTGDELEALGDQFNNMAERLQESYATLERKIEERSRFLAAASHDLRQPLHAIGLSVALLHGRLRASERKLVIERIEAALSATNELFNTLLDISRLDAGALAPNMAAFPVAQLLGQIETTFAEAARRKGLSLRVIRSSAWVWSDFILVERIVFNLISNAIRYTSRGGIIVGCRKRGNGLRIEVWDSGVGIPLDQQEKIFGEFYRLGGPDRGRGAGLGLGLAIVDRLCRLLNHCREIRSTPGKGSMFAVTMPIAAPVETPVMEAPNRERREVSKGKLVLVIDDDPFTLEGMDGILRSWGCHVITADTDSKALRALTEENHSPDLIISDYHFSSGRTGVEIIERLRAALSVQIPAFLISGDVNPKPVNEVEARDLHILQKPVNPMALRAMLHQALKRHQNGAEQRVAS